MKRPTKKYMVGGVDQKDGGWIAVLEVHHPCSGGDHKDCVVVERNESPVYASQEEAIAAIKEVQRDSGLDGWEPTGRGGSA